MPLNNSHIFSFLQLTMSPFFDCFCLRQRHRSRSTPKEEVGQKIRLSSLFTAADKEESITTERANIVQRGEQSGVDDELVKEAKFLKASGTLPHTPAEIRKAVSFAASLEKTDKQRPISEVNSPLKTPGAIKEIEALSKNIETASNEPLGETPEEIPKPETSTTNSEDSYSHKNCDVPKSSPYPTPRKITDDMQTPGTAFATNMTNLAKGNARIRSQYVHTTLNPVEDLNQENGAVIEPLDTKDHLSEKESATPCSSVQSGCDLSKDNKVEEVGLSSWLKPPLGRSDADKKPDTKRTIVDRPIIGLVGTHWKEEGEETSHVPPKWWDGNGIPNSTTKYKEDQKVCWHATPFEERLEKALSEESSSASQKKSITGTPIMFDERDGHDTATSQLQQMNCAKSVISF